MKDAEHVAPRIHVVLALLALLVLLLFGEAVGGRTFFDRDLHLLWYGQARSFVRCVTEGAWPVWDPYVSFGQPMLANPNAQVLYPFTWLHLVVVPATQLTIYVIVHVWASAVGAWFLARRLGASPPAALLGGALWACSGPLLSLVPAWNHLGGAAWLPWMTLAGDRALCSGRLRDAALWGAVAAGQFLAGSPDMSLLSMLLASAMLAHSMRAAPSSHGRRRVAMTVGSAAAWAVMLAAAQWVPSAALLGDAPRRELSSEVRTYWSVHPAALPRLFLPLRVNELPLTDRQRAALFESREPFLPSLYLGVPALALAVAGAGGAMRYRRSFLFVGIAAVLLSLGPHAPVYDAVATLFPPLRMMRYPEKFVVLAAFGHAMLAASGYDAVRERAGGARRVAVIAALSLATLGMLVVAVGALAPGIGLGRIPLPLGSTLGRLLAPQANALVAHAAIAVIALIAATRVRVAYGATVIAALAVLDLFSAHHLLNPTAPRSIFDFRPQLLDHIDQTDGARLYVFDYWSVVGRSQEHLGRANPHLIVNAPTAVPFGVLQAVALRTALLPPSASAWGIYGSYDVDVVKLRPHAQSRLAQALVAAEGTPTHLKLLQMGAVGTVVALHHKGLEALSQVAELPSYFPEPLRVFRVPNPLPRAYLVGRARRADADRALGVVLDESFDPHREVVLADAPVAPEAALDAARRVTIVESRADRVRLRTEAGSPAYLVLVDAYAPGWKVFVDGRPAALLRANTSFRAVALSAGRHEVEMRYRPLSLILGAVMSSVGLIAFGVVAAKKDGP